MSEQRQDTSTATDGVRSDTGEFSRRELLVDGARLLTGGAMLLSGGSLAGRVLAAGPNEEPAVRVALMTDIHYADKPTNGSRHYRKALPRVRRAVEALDARKPTFAVEIGDFIDGGDTRQQELEALEAIEAQFAAFRCPGHYVLGNHDLHHLSKEEFGEATGARRPYYAFDSGGIHFVILDACYRQDGEPYHRGNFEWTNTAIPPDEIEWLKADLASTDRPTVVFVHQPLGLSPNNTYAVKNATSVRDVLAASGQVQVVLQGHHHRNAHRVIDGIHYCTLEAVVEGPEPTDNAYGLLEVYDDGSMTLEGFRQLASYTWDA